MGKVPMGEFGVRWSNNLFCPPKTAFLFSFGEEGHGDLRGHLQIRSDLSIREGSVLDRLPRILKPADK